MNSLPEVWKFLREPGGVDFYPGVSLQWKKGQSPELRIGKTRSSAGVPEDWLPGHRNDEEVLEQSPVDLSMYDFQELHYLMQSPLCA